VFREYLPALSDNQLHAPSLNISSSAACTLSTAEKAQLIEISTKHRLKNSLKSLLLISFWQRLRNHFPELQEKLLQICHFQLPIHEKKIITLVGKPHAEMDLT
jgi:hypothetical protein